MSQQKEHNRKAEWINNLKGLEWLEKGCKENIHRKKKKRVTLKKVRDLKALGNDGICKFCSEKITSIHFRCLSKCVNA